jgi:hypothetical protein
MPWGTVSRQYLAHSLSNFPFPVKFLRRGVALRAPSWSAPVLFPLGAQRWVGDPVVWGRIYVEGFLFLFYAPQVFVKWARFPLLLLALGGGLSC